MKQQGETTSTVERIRGLQTDIHDLRSQNDSLKAEIEAQQAAHKAQLSAAENRAHESWLGARQTQRRFEETVAEAGALRRKLTSLSASGTAADGSREYYGFLKIILYPALIVIRLSVKILKSKCMDVF